MPTERLGVCVCVSPELSDQRGWDKGMDSDESGWLLSGRQQNKHPGVHIPRQSYLWRGGGPSTSLQQDPGSTLPSCLSGSDEV